MFLVRDEAHNESLWAIFEVTQLRYDTINIQ